LELASKITDSRNVRPSMVRLISSTYAGNTRAPHDSATAKKIFQHALVDNKFHGR